MNKGFITLHRRIEDHWLWQDKPFTKGQAWIDMLIACNHDGKKLLIKSVVIKCKRGESINSLDTWADRWGWNKSKVRRFLKMLKSDTMIVLKPTQQTTHLSIVNYDTYQMKRHADETQVKRKRNTSETELTPNNNDNNDNNDNKKDIPTFQDGVDAFIDFSTEYFKNANESFDYNRLKLEAEEFSSYWFVANKGCKTNWEKKKRSDLKATARSRFSDRVGKIKKYDNNSDSTTYIDKPIEPTAQQKAENKKKLDEALKKIKDGK